MRFADLFSLAFRGLLEQKLRTALALLGVIIASVLIILCLAASEGLQAEIARQFDMGDRLRRIEIFPGQASPEETIPPKLLVVKGKMSEAKRKRIRQAIIDHWNRRHYRPKVPLTPAKLREIERIPHVASVEPDITRSCTVEFGGKNFGGRAQGVSIGNEYLADQIVAGSAFATNDAPSILVHEYLAYYWGYTGDDDVKQLLGKKITLKVTLGGYLRGRWDAKLSAKEVRILNRIARQLPKIADQLPLKKEERDVLKKAFRGSESGSDKEFTVSQEYTIVGILRDSDTEERKRFRRWGYRPVSGADVVLPMRTAEDFSAMLPQVKQDGFFRATVIVDDTEHVEAVAEKLKAMDLNPFALTDILERVQFNVKVITYVMAVLGAVALFVAGIGIANTMVMTVMERTHEIGIMKAIGARDGDVQRIFLVEGVFLGLLGGGLGLLIGWGLSFPLNSFIVQKLESRFRNPIHGSLFDFPWWLSTGVPLFAAVITMLAAVYPARRAARIDPIKALRHD